MERKEKKEKKVSPLKGSCLWGVLLFGILLLIDMVTKVAAQEYFARLGAPDKVDIIPGWISLTISYNRGIAYGIGTDSPMWVKFAVVAVTAVMMAVFAVMYFRLDKRRAWLRVALVFVVAGGVGNLIDRVYYQVWDPASISFNPYIADGVRDMVDLSRFGFAVCNFADFFIVGGAITLVVSLFFFDVDAIFPVGKYKVMAQEEAEKAEAKKAAKEAAKQGLTTDEEENG